jgi:5-oxoprolinase (ATP-hydrolysing)/N-methylhydantoinase A
MTATEAPPATAPHGLVRCAIDIGGTFTDFLLLDDASGDARIHKRLTTPADPAEGALAGLDELLAIAGLDHAALGSVVHGSTLVTNLVIERKGAPTALITTRGFRDVLELGTEQRYDVHDIFLKFPTPLVPRHWRFEVDERMSRDGAVLTPLDPGQLHEAAAQAVAEGVQAVAVVFLHAYRNDAHERAAAAHLRQHFPQLHLSISSEVCGEIREYERSSTTVANAYAQPLIAPYIARLEQRLQQRGFRGQFFLVQSSGTLASAAMARRLPIRLLESGPAGGGLAAAHFGRAGGRPDVISFDMGGTTAKVCLIQDGRPDLAPMLEAAREHRFKRGSGLPIRAPTIDMIEIGAGGGSIAHVDEIGLMKVGPQSASAVPGPACYGTGGTDPTVTDANVLLGYLGADSFLGGRLVLDQAAAEAAFAGLGARLGLSALQAAWGVFAVVCENMAGAARVHVVEKGRDPRRFAMVAFGGAGPAHAVRVAKSLGVDTVIVPPASGAASAFGFLGAPVAHESARSAPALLAELDWSPVNAMLAELEADGRANLATAGLAADAVAVRREAELRLAGQVHTLRVAVPGGRLEAAAFAALEANFAAAYRRLYARDPFGGELEVISWRVTCTGPAASPGLRRLIRPDAAPRPMAWRLAWFPETGRQVPTPVHSRYALAPGAVIAGPAIVEEDEATTVIPPGDEVSVDALGNLVIAVRAAAARPAAADEPADTAMARLEQDPVGLEIMWSRLITISEECWLTVIRTAFSLIISEAQDFACEILDGQGQSLAHSPRAMPVFNIALMTAVQAVLEEFPVGTLQPGDVLLTNDPWTCAGHLFDIAVVTPAFRFGRVVGFIGSVGHVSDIGGTKDRGGAREVYEEGIQLPPLKLYAAGVPNRDLLRILDRNVRNPRQVLGDVQALVAANALGAERLESFLAEYGLPDLVALAAVMQRRGETAVREAIRKVPNGIYRRRTEFIAAGERLSVPLELTVADQDITVDYAGAPPQLARGGVNCTLTVTRAETMFALKCVFTPGIRATAGCYRPFAITAPEGSLFNCARPGAVGLRRLTMWYFVGTIFRALSEVIPAQVQAFTALPTMVDIYGAEADGSVFTDHLFVGGGQGGSAGQDGKSGVIWPTSAANTSIEMAETRLPVVVMEKALIADSAGGGRHRGGLGQRLRLRRLHDAGPRLYVNVYPEGELTTDGLAGGLPGGLVRCFRFDANGQCHEYRGSTMVDLRAGEIIEVRTGGGAGFGAAACRAAEAIARDCRDGYVT